MLLLKKCERVVETFRSWFLSRPFAVYRLAIVGNGQFVLMYSGYTWRKAPVSSGRQGKVEL